MKKVISSLFYLLMAYSVNAQLNCPQGYEVRDVKCNGIIVSKCFPINYTCKDCWVIEWQNCDGDWKHSGGVAWHSSYEKCLEDAEKTKNGNLYHPCPELMNKYVYRIYNDDSKFCDNNTNYDQDRNSKLTMLYNKWKRDIADASLQYKGYAGIPNPLSTTREWGANIQESLRKLNLFREFIDQNSTKNFSEIENQFNDFTRDYKNFQKASNNFRSQLQNTASISQWVKLPDDTYYKILISGMYSFYDGVDQIETVSEEEGKKELLKHQKGNITKEVKSMSLEDIESLKELETVVAQLEKQIKELKEISPDVDTKEFDKQLQEVKKQIAKLKAGNN